SAAAENIAGAGGSDQLIGAGGADLLDGGDGDDILDGGLGYDGVEGGAGNDRIYGVGLLNGGADNDVITVRSTAQVYANAHGNDGDDRIYGGTGTDYLFGDAGNDALYAGNLNNGLYGGDGNDRLFTEFGGSDLNGEAGDDFMQARADETAWTEFDGGTGFDTVSYRNAVGDSWDRGVSISGDRGQTGAATNDWYISVEKFVLSDFDDTLIGNTMSVSGQAFEARGYDGNDDLRGGAGLDSLFGGDGDDDLAGNAADDHLYGGAGTDDLKGGDGIDTLDGGGSSTGADVLAGGAGADTFVFKVGHGSVDLTDYVWGEDRLDVATFVAGSHTWFMVGHGPDTEVVFSTGDTIVFRGVDTTVVQQIMDEATGPGDVFEPMTPPDRLGLETHGDHDVAAPAFVLAGGEWLLAG
ncbi:MAG TPA: calcium-binding protein, partial [Caulobacteraceae bacterium]|nr:calcium-binding protein [Caulobacteraceae bacterium]